MKRLMALACTAIALGALVSKAGQPAPDRKPAPVPARGPKMARDVFKNIQVLKDTEADRINPAMQFMTGALGVDCGFCHVDGPAFERDDVPAKQVAREMVQMQFAINQNTSLGNARVTCNTCHRGSPHPASLPVLLPAQPRLVKAEGEAASDAAAAGRILDRFVRATGGAERIAHISSLVEKGTFATGLLNRGQPVAFEVYAKEPNKRLEIVHRTDGESMTAFDGVAGWTKTPGAPASAMSSRASQYFEFFADLQAFLHFKEMFRQLQVRPRETLDERPVHIVVAVADDRPPVTLYFDAKSGLLVRLLRYSETPVGPNPVQIDYADYRDVGGLLAPFRRTTMQAGFTTVVKLETIEPNAPIEDSRFVKPL